MDHDAAGGTGTVDRTAEHRSAWSLRRLVRLLVGDGSRPTWRNAHVVAVTGEIDATAVREWLPPAVRFASPPRATLFLADYPDTSFGVAYRECGLLLHVRYLRRAYLHCPWMVVDDDTALILGRDLLGFPKKLARIDVSFDGSGAAGIVERRGVELVRLEGATDEDLEDARPFPESLLNARGVPGVAPGLLLRMTPEQAVHRARRFSGRLTIGSSDVDPLDRLGLPAEVEGIEAILDMSHPLRSPTLGVFPVGVVSPRWMLRAFPFRAW